MEFIKKLKDYILEYKKNFILLIIIVLLRNGIDLARPYISKIIIDKGIISKNIFIVNLWGGILLILFLIYSRLMAIETVTSNKIQQGVVYRLRNKVYHKLQRLSLSYFNKEKKGDILSKLMSDVEQLQRIITDGFIIFLMSIFTFFGAFFILLKLNKILTLFMMFPITGIGFLVYTFTEKAHKGYRELRKIRGELTSSLQENIFGIKEIKAYAREKRQLVKFSFKGRKFFKINIYVAKLWATYQSWIIFLSSVGYLIVIWFGGRKVLTGEISIGTLVAYIGYLHLLYTPIHQLNHVNHLMQHARAAGERIFGIMDAYSDVKDSLGAISLPNPLKGNVKFENVYFAYEKENYVLKNISFEVKGGEKVALVGPSGAGKSTLVSLIPRFYDVNKGAIYIDEKEIKNYKIFYLRSQIGIVLQEPFIFSGTIFENITFGKEDVTEDEVIEAAKLANAHEFISNLPDGYETDVGDMGNSLSVGQKQRIAIARVFLKNPSILILDEFTSSLDAESESLILEALERLIEGRTVFIIAHRLSLVRNVDKIIVLNEGEIIEKGTHLQLLRKRGLYYKLYNLQYPLEKIEKEINELNKLF
ncbi:MAG: ABC transporter ATP-binding protein/permease [Candidatus Omnitrophica bacterium]|nr:ABC transporter ATP-binding protein/permease [Candidatus Omnitrophota bacterium]MCM8802780.1 ABC transporter ATP-binding protein/permease [Candidatus Omnitrophota bacterium]